MSVLSRSVGGRIHALIGALALVVLLTAGATWTGIRVWQAQMDEAMTTGQRSLLAERVNAWVYAAVMDTRGIYAAHSDADLRKFAAGLGASLDHLQTDLARWQALVPPAQAAGFATLKTAAESFLRFRREAVRLGLTEGAAAVDAFSNNDANRNNRMALNAALATVAGQNAAAAEQQAHDLAATGRQLSWALLAGAGLAVGVVALTARRVVRRTITAPLGRVSAALEAIGGGRLDLAVPETARGDEIGAIARATDGLLGALRRKAELELQARAELDARAARAAATAEAVIGFDRDLAGATGALGHATAQIEAAAQRLRTMAQDAAETGAAVAGASDQTSANVQTVAAAAEQLAASVDEIGRQAAQSSGIAGRAVAEAGRTTDAVAGLAGTAERIGSVVALIGDIAGQTNLLALNATIEAARAGEAGRGFAVVAGEVKSLAGQTARATEEIGTQVGAIAGATEAVVAAIRGIGATIEEMHRIATAIAAAVEQQGAATREIARNVAEAARGAAEMGARVGAVGAAGRQADRESVGLLEAAGELGGQTARLRGIVDGFVARLRAA